MNQRSGHEPTPVDFCDSEEHGETENILDLVSERIILLHSLLTNSAIL